MKVQPISNTNFQRLVVKNPQQIPREIYQGIVDNEGIKDLADLMEKRGTDLIAEYVKTDCSSKRAIQSNVLLHNAKQYYNRYFKYNEAPYKNEYKSIYSINDRWSSDEELLDELYYFDPYDIRVEVHDDVCDYFDKIKEERAKQELGDNLQKSVEPKKQSFWKRLFK